MKKGLLALSLAVAGCYTAWSYWSVKVDWVDPPPVKMSAGMDYPVTVAVAGGSNVSHINIHWSTSGDPRYDPEGTTVAQSGTAGQFNFVLNFTAAATTTYYLAIHAEVDGADYYGEVLPVTVVPGPPYVEWTTLPPDPMQAATDYGVDFTVTGGSSVDSVRVQWAVSRDPSAQPAGWTTAQSGSPGLFSETLNLSPAQDTTYLFVVRAEVDGEIIYSPVVSRLVAVAGPSDPNEVNDDFASATYLGGSGATGTVSAYLYPSGDRDFYEVTSGGGLLSLDLTNLPADYDLYLYDDAGELVDFSTQYGTTDEQIAVTVSSGTYYIEVRGYREAWSDNSYDLSYDVP